MIRLAVLFLFTFVISSAADTVTTIQFIAYEEGIGGNYSSSDRPYSVSLFDNGAGTLEVDGNSIKLEQISRGSGRVDGQQRTETRLEGQDHNTLIVVTIEKFPDGGSRSSIYWPETNPTREILGFNDERVTSQ